MALFGRPTEEDEQRAAAYRNWLRQRNPYAIASLVLSIFSLIEAGVLLVFGVAGMALGVVALRQLRRPDPDRPYGRRLAWAGIVISSVSLVMAAVLYGMSWSR